MLFEPRSGVTTLLLAAYFDNDLMALVRRLLGSEEKYPVWQAVLDGLRER
jgi:hypothetical protein